MSELRRFNKKCKTDQKEATRPPTPPPDLLFCDEVWRSARSSSPPTVKSRLKEFTGLTPQGATQWTRETLCVFFDILAQSDIAPRPFIDKIVAKKKSPVATPLGLYWLHKNGNLQE